MHQALEIIAGLGPVFGDTQSNELPRKVLNLLNVNGFAVRLDGWTPGLPTLKAGGAWVDTSLAAGRELVAGQVGNVIETMTLSSMSATLRSRYALESELMKFAHLTRSFWVEEWQYEPVYLKWHAPDAPGPQYALLYNIDVAARGEPFSGDLEQEIVITMEREPYWRALPPGGNPKLWTLESRQIPVTLSNQAIAGNDSLVYESVYNRQEWSNVNLNQFLTKNFIDIPASLIPGDAPALGLVTLVEKPLKTFTPSKVYMGIHYGEVSHPFPYVGEDTALQFNTYNAADYGFGDNFFDSTSIGVRHAATSIVRSRSFSLGPQTGSTFQVGSYKSSLKMPLMTGTYAVFLRNCQSNGVPGDVRIQLEILQSGAVYRGTEVNAAISTPPSQTELGNTYLGQLNLPFDGATVGHPRGTGLDIYGSEAVFRFAVRNYSASSRTLIVTDLIFMPMHAGMIVANSIPSIDGIFGIGFDNTGYLTRGKIEDIVRYGLISSPAVETDSLSYKVEHRGWMPVLLPGRNNRLYFLIETQNSNMANSSKPEIEAFVSVNIVPRWSGIRDQ